MPIQHRLAASRFYHASWPQFKLWINEHSSAVRWDTNGPCSWLNGDVYFTTLLFDSEEDLLVATLMFPEMMFWQKI